MLRLADVEPDGAQVAIGLHTFEQGVETLECIGLQVVEAGIHVRLAKAGDGAIIWAAMPGVSESTRRLGSGVTGRRTKERADASRTA